MPDWTKLSHYPNMPDFAAPAADAEAATAVSVTLSVTPAAPAHGATLTAAYAVSGLAPGTGTPVTVTGEATVGTASFPVTASFTMPGAPAAAVTYQVPTAAGLTFKATANPAAFTAVVP